ncbi:MAG: hypothetical protein IKD66_01760 [Solobacterium sp.]|nr:hypothetical protein [Solobacterium sp.]
MTEDTLPPKLRFGLSGNALKLIAILTMTIDHLAWMGIETYAQAETPVQIILHMIGRLTAPIFIYLMAEGYHNTRHFPSYLKRVALLAFISHFAFCYFNMQSFNPLNALMFNATSIAWPLLWGLIFLKVWDTGTIPVYAKVLITIIGCVLTFTSDWSCAAPLAVLMIGRNQGSFHKQMLWLMALTTGYAVLFAVFNNTIYGMMHLFCWLDVPLLSLYDGTRGKVKWLGRFFYWYYPVHLALIGLLARML